jgi:hypothetical protein
MSLWWPTRHIGITVAHMLGQLGVEIFLDETQKGARMGFEPVTAWSLEASTTGLLFQLCCDAS